MADSFINIIPDGSLLCFKPSFSHFWKVRGLTPEYFAASLILNQLIWGLLEKIVEGV